MKVIAVCLFDVAEVWLARRRGSRRNGAELPPSRGFGEAKFNRGEES